MGSRNGLDVNIVVRGSSRSPWKDISQGNGFL